MEKEKTLSEKVNKGWLDNTDEDLFSYKDVKEAIKEILDKEIVAPDMNEEFRCGMAHAMILFKKFIKQRVGEELSK